MNFKKAVVQHSIRSHAALLKSLAYTATVLILFSIYSSAEDIRDGYFLQSQHYLINNEVSKV